MEHAYECGSFCLKLVLRGGGDAAISALHLRVDALELLEMSVFGSDVVLWRARRDS